MGVYFGVRLNLVRLANNIVTINMETLMTDSAKKRSEETVLICRHLLGGDQLHWVHHFPNEENTWSLMCGVEHQRSEMEEKSIVEVTKLFPEVNELMETPRDMDVSFKKGINSGKWYDFHRN